MSPALLLLAACAPSTDTGGGGADTSTHVALVDGARTIAGCPSLPADDVWNTPVVGLGAVADNARRIAWLQQSFDGPLGPGACASVWEGSRCGIPWTVADADTPWKTVHFAGPYVWGDAEFPLPDGFRIEGEPNPDGAWDRHVLIVDGSTCVLHEIINVRSTVLGLYADGAARWDLRSNGYATEAWAQAEAAGLPMVPGIYSFEEVEAGVIPHALRIALPLVGSTAVWPARTTDGRSADADATPMGARLRLRADVDRSGLGPQAAVIAEALATYGAIVADTTVTRWALTGVPDSRWDEADLDGLSAFTPEDFEWVDVSAWAGDGTTMQAPGGG